jgi:hypothetical protein
MSENTSLDDQPRGDAHKVYEDISVLLEKENPYGNTGVRIFLDRARIAGWLQRVNSSDPVSTCTDKLQPSEDEQCFNWNFPWPEAPDDLAADQPFVGTQPNTYRVCKAILIPMEYRRDRDGALIRAVILCGIGGSGGHRDGPHGYPENPVDPPVPDPQDPFDQGFLTTERTDPGDRRSRPQRFPTRERP